MVITNRGERSDEVGRQEKEGKREREGEDGLAWQGIKVS